MADIITTLHPENDADVNLYPNVKKENIPNASIDRSKLDSAINSLLDSINSLHPAGVDTSANILAFTEDKGVWVGSDNGKWYYWDGSSYIVGGDFIPNDLKISIKDLDSQLFEELFKLTNVTDITSTFTLVNYYLDKANGNSNPDPNSRSTDYIDTSTYEYLLITGYAQYATCLICTYDANHQFLRYYCEGGSAGKAYTDYLFIPKSDEIYVKFGTYQYTSYPLVIKTASEFVSIAKTKRNNYLKGKKYVACGDSYTKGDVISSNKVYPYLIANRNDMTLVNMAQNGGYIHYGENGFTNPSNSAYYQNIPLDADYITIAYGLNETSTSLGTKDSNDNTTIWGAYNEVLGWIITNIPNAKVGIISNDGWMTYELRNTLQDIANYWGVEFLDLKEYGKPLLISGKYSQDGSVKSSVVTLRTNQYCVSSTNGHPNELGHMVRSYIIENFLNGETSTNTIPLSKIVDNKGNHRFVEGNGIPLSQAGVTISYCKWSLSGTHLMLACAGSVTNTTVINAVQLGQFYLPKYISDKITATFSNRVEIKSLVFYASNFSSQSVNCSLAIDNVNHKAVILTHGSVTMTADRNFRIQFDALIDQD